MNFASKLKMEIQKYLKTMIVVLSIMYVVDAVPVDMELKLISEVLESRSVLAKYDPRKFNMTITYSFYPLFIISLDERQQVLTSSGWVEFVWVDSRFAWNASEYGGIDKVYINQNKIWMPDFTVENSVTDFGIMGSGDNWVVLYSDGKVEWSPGDVFRTICEVDVGQFPFDSQNCFLNISTWMYYTDEIRLVPAEEPVVLKFYKTNSEWDVLSLSVAENKYVYSYTTDTQDAISFNFKLKRRSAFYILKIIIPTVILSVLNSFVFIVPPESGEKVSMSVTTMLSLTVFLSYIGEVTPNNSESIPVIALFVVLHLSLGALSIITNIIIMDVHYKILKKSREANGFDVQSNILTITNNNDFSSEDEKNKTNQKQLSSSEARIKKAAKLIRIIDKTFFVIFLVLSFAVTGVCVLKMLF